MFRLIYITVLVVLGAAFAFNAFGSASFVLSYNRNFITIAVTSFLSDNEFNATLNLEQHVLHYLSLGPHAFLIGLIASLAFRRDLAIIGIVFWMIYAATTSVLLIRESFRWDELTWYSMLPDAVGFACTIPLYLLGISAGLAIKSRSFPRFTILDLCASAVAVALLCVVSLSRSGWLPPTVFSAILVWLAYRFATGRQEAGNHRMQRIGGGDDLQVVGQLPPPADA
ncbi:hypothetical protein LOC71_04990 [Rhodopirellula sp. JC740]|uniref:Rhomboid family intramembrane serine protease n=1 Tax=Rhodopirellula halodulae TaxID=2894198 RepID=A0ABS8NDH8_9BACT|nr:hypothetical protein [Rhodopirellula sp. JC740]MCC9641620.1 hypothetical protein [Rhodopirellula sp. JC740]